MMVFGFAALLAILAIIHFLARLIVSVFTMKRRIKSRMLIGSSGILVLAFFLTITSNMLQPLRCDQNPNGVYTVGALNTFVPET